MDNKIYCTVKPWQCCTSLTELSDLNGSIVGVMSLKSFLSQSLHLLLLDAYSGLRTSRQTNGDNFQNYLLWWFLTMVRLLLHVKYDVLMSNIIWITIFNFVQYLELYTIIYTCEWVGGRCHHIAGWRGPLILLVSADQLRYIPALNHLSRLQPHVIWVPRVLWNMMDRTHMQGQDVLIGSLSYMRSKETT